MATAATAGSIGLGVFGAALLAQPAGAVTATLTVDASGGADTGNCTITSCLTLGYALSQAAAGDTILIEPGTYPASANPAGTSNTVPAALNNLTIQSDAGTAANTIIEGAPANGLEINADDVTVSGLTFDHSGAAGILVTPPSTATAPAAVNDVTLNGVVSSNSDQCVNTPTTPTCTAAIGAGDYGESLWLESVTNSVLENSTLTNGLAGGLLLSDEVGPSFGNTIENNMAVNNLEGCGLTLAAHNMNAIFSSGPNAGQPNPAGGGVYNNTVEGNTSSGNGATGIGVFNVAYNNTIQGNTFNNNGEPGIEIEPDVPRR